jgi:hypothetical protein
MHPPSTSKTNFGGELLELPLVKKDLIKSQMKGKSSHQWKRINEKKT